MQDLCKSEAFIGTWNVCDVSPNQLIKEILHELKFVLNLASSLQKSDHVPIFPTTSNNVAE